MRVFTQTGVGVLVVFLAAFVMADEGGPASQPATQPDGPRVVVLRQNKLIGGAALCGAFSPDGKMFATGHGGGTVAIWDVATRQPTQVFHAHPRSLRFVAWSPDGKMVATGSTDKKICLWDAATGKLARTIEVQDDLLFNVAFSPDGKTLALASEWRANDAVRLWDLATGKATQTVEHLPLMMTGVVFSPDGKTIAVTGSSDTALVDVASGKTLHVLNASTIRLPTGGIPGVAFSPDGKTLAGASRDNNVRLWDVGTGEELHTCEGHKDSVFSVAFSPDGKTLASASKDQTIRLWDAAKGTLIRTLEKPAKDITGVVFTADGRTVAVASGYDEGHIDFVNGKMVVDTRCATIRLWDVAGNMAAHAP